MQLLLLPLLACLASTHGDPHASAAYGRTVPPVAPDHIYPATGDLMLVWHVDDKVVWRRYPQTQLAALHHVHEPGGARVAVRFVDGTERALIERPDSDLKTEVGQLAMLFDLAVDVDGQPPERPPDTSASDPGETGEPIFGALDKTLIDQTIRAEMPRVRACYQLGLDRNFSLGGLVVVKFVITKDGTVSSSTVKATTMGDEEVETCILDTFLELAFPEPKGGGKVIVSYPFVFAPE